jgi:putative oxygen-independent coproporphyrinogen III oxidase
LHTRAPGRRAPRRERVSGRRHAESFLRGRHRAGAKRARRHLHIAADAEVTLEANPGTVERGRFAEYRFAGVNRVSLGGQSFDARQLKALGRIHSPFETERAAAELHAAGLANFNIDLMYALPGQDAAAALSDIEQALALDPAHLSHYQLTIEAGTAFAAHPPALPSDDGAAQILEACQSRLATAHFERYEVSAYARAGFECQHNLNYWRFGDYLGVGAGAHGKISMGKEHGITAHRALARAAALHERISGGTNARQSRRARCAVRIHAECAAPR